MMQLSNLFWYLADVCTDLGVHCVIVPLRDTMLGPHILNTLALCTVTGQSLI